jgi:preprotein translocase subunit SecG
LFYVLIVIHVFACLFLIVSILLQAGKGADMGAIFGGGGAQTLFGASGGATFMSKLTSALAVVFMLTCLSLAYISSHTASIMPKEGAGPAQPAADEGEPADENAPAQPSGGEAAPAQPAAGGEQAAPEAPAPAPEAPAPAPEGGSTK